MTAATAHPKGALPEAVCLKKSGSPRLLFSTQMTAVTILRVHLLASYLIAAMTQRS